MASFVSSATRRTGFMLTATAQPRRMVVVYICFLLLAAGSSAHSVKSCGKKDLVVYDHEVSVPPGLTSVIATTPSGKEIVEFGTIVVLDNFLRTESANDSTQLGRVRGLLIVEKDLSLSASLTLELTAPCIGSLATQGTLDQEGNGEIAVTGGTGAYRFVKGYLEVLSISGPVNAVYKFTIHLKYF